jgi:V/A-type H+-transporting ATPase subunit K
MSRIRTFRTVALLSIAMLFFVTIGTAYAQSAGDGHKTPPGESMMAGGAPYFAVAITMGLACLAAAFAVGKVGAAAMGAAAEKPEILTKAIVFAGLGEGIAIFGLIVSLFLINKI